MREDMPVVQQLRTSYGSQIEDALNDLLRHNSIDAWGLSHSEMGALHYHVEGTRIYFPLFTPGEMADWLNERGYHVDFGTRAQPGLF